MVKSLTDYMAENDWGDMDDEAKINVMATYIVDLESRVERAERDIDIVDGGASY